ncbi:mitochondrial import inner membrane translocase subunit Tim9 [Macrosteles quadrilineatus]|uniref:mitochondrial import inner membrane translocase subunit Tim9 n=1 Tax=Macrosteles quadrilineatus TaxID=74068 RepID=UPI0023E1F2A5|nr:mitochondrial import inner membrane translocase subunit Tim9 [Macrosteles quadrilineatus]
MSDPLRNFKDFLLQYNRISESCFLRCINTFGQRDMTFEEINCSDACVQKHTKLNLKVMQVYVEVQPQIVQKRIEEMNKTQQVAAGQEAIINTAGVETSQTVDVAEKSSTLQS